MSEMTPVGLARRVLELKAMPWDGHTAPEIWGLDRITDIAALCVPIAKALIKREEVLKQVASCLELISITPDQGPYQKRARWALEQIAALENSDG